MSALLVALGSFVELIVALIMLVVGLFVASYTIDGKNPVGWFWNYQDQELLASMALITILLQMWMVIEAIIVWPRVRGVLEKSLPAFP